MDTGKLLFAGALIAAAGGILWFILGSQTNKDPGETLVVGYGNVVPAGVEMNIAVGILTLRADPPRLVNGIQQLDEWVKDHFTVRDSSGAPVPIRRIAHSKLIPDSMVGVPEFYVMATLKPGAAYTIDFVPVLAAGNKYRASITAPAAAVDAERVNFQPL